MTEQQEHILTQKLAESLQRLQAERRGDKETMWMLGSIAARLIDDAKAKSWTALKRNLDRASYDALIVSAQQQGTMLLEKGRPKPAIAIEALVTSVIASRFETPAIKDGEALLDEMIDTTVAAYRRSRKGAN